MKKVVMCIIFLLVIAGISVYCVKIPGNANKTDAKEIKSSGINEYNQSNINQTIKKLKNNPALRDDIFSEYLKTVEDDVSKLNDNLPLEIYDKTDVSQIDSKLLKQYRLSGIDFACGEGSCYAIIGYKYLYELFNQVLTPEYNKYLLIMAEEADNPYAADGGIIVSFELLRKRMAMCEEFLNTYPNFIKSDDIKNNMQMYSYAYKNGLDNTPVICSKEEKLSNPERTKDISDSYALYLKEAKDKNSEYYKEIENCYKIIR